MAVSVTIILVAAGLLALLTFLPSIRGSDDWSATITPLASIMGSGFLICAPLLGSIVGNWSPAVMVGLLLTAWSIGGAIRFNIRLVEPLVERGQDQSRDADSHHRLHASHRDSASSVVVWPERLSHFVLAIAYFISTTYYVQLLSQFSLQSFGVESALFARSLATGVAACSNR